MAAKYQFQLIDSDTGKLIGQPTLLPGPFPFNVGDYYFFGDGNRTQISAVAHYFANVGQDQVYTTHLILSSIPILSSESRVAKIFDARITLDGDPIVPWPW